jgi:LETM1 and EF-hand domain-containing protein 1
VCDTTPRLTRQYRATGDRASTMEVLEVCKKFSDDLTLDNLSRPQLVTLCRFMGINAVRYISMATKHFHQFGTDNFLRFAIHKKMQEIKKDDKVL